MTFGDGSGPNQWAVVSDLGGTAEVNADCAGYGGPDCIYARYTFNGASAAFNYGVDYPGTRFDCGQAAQFAPMARCGGPFGPGSTYCDTVLRPTP